MKIFQSKKSVLLSTITALLLGAGVIYTNCGSDLQNESSILNNGKQDSADNLSRTSTPFEGVRTVLKPKACGGIGLEPLPGYVLKIIEKNKVAVFKNEGGKETRMSGESTVSCEGCSECKTSHDGPAIYCEGGPCQESEQCGFNVITNNGGSTAVDTVK